MSYILRSQVGSYRFYYATFRCHVLFVGSRVAIKCWNIWTFSSDERCIAEQTESCLMPDDSWTCSWNDRDKERSFAAMFGETCARVNDNMFTGSRERVSKSSVIKAGAITEHSSQFRRVLLWHVRWLVHRGFGARYHVLFRKRYSRQKMTNY